MHAYNIYSVLLEQASFQVEKLVSFLNSIRNVRRLFVAISVGGCAHVMSLFLLWNYICCYFFCLASTHSTKQTESVKISISISLIKL